MVEDDYCSMFQFFFVPDRSEEEGSVAKRAMTVAKAKAYDELYDRLDDKEGEKDLYTLAEQRDRTGKDVQQVRLIKDRE